jgi:anticodon-binding protein
MSSDQPTLFESPSLCQFSAEDIAEILRARGWIADDEDGAHNEGLAAWLQRAADLLAPQASDIDGLAELLTPIFQYDAISILKSPANQDVLARTGARDVIRELANRILEGGDVDSDRFKKIVEGIKEAVSYRSRAMFHPIRVALTGRAGEGELDRVILLLDSAAKLSFTTPAKSTRQRMLEFCTAFD